MIIYSKNLSHLNLKSANVWLNIFNNKAILIILMIGLFQCQNTIPDRLFFKPEGTQLYTYKNTPEKLTITAYPRPTGTIKGSIIFIHGGGWQVGGSDLPVYADWHYLLKDASLAAYSIEHRTAPKYRGDQILQDCKDAIAFIQKHNQDSGIYAKNYSIVGYSSGGHLAVLTALELSKKSNPDLRSVVAYYAPLDLAHLVHFEDNRLLKLYEHYIPGLQMNEDSNDSKNLDLRNLLKYHSPIEKIHNNIPKMLLIHGKKDALVPFSQSVNFALVADRIAPGKVSILLLDKAEHNFVSSRSKWARKIDKAAFQFILESFPKIQNPG